MRVRMFAAVLVFVVVPALAFAEVAKVTVANRVTVASGQAFGTTGPYEKLTGTIEFTLDPKEPHNARVTDLDRAPRDAAGRVHFTSDMMVLRPTDPAKANGVLLFEVINRGRLGLLDRFNSADGADDPLAPADFGNGYLMREGYTLVFVGWQFDIRPPLLRVEAPAIDGLIEPIKVRFLPDAKTNEAALNDAPLYQPVNPADAASTLTVRDHYWDTPTPIERAKWHFVAGQQGAPRSPFRVSSSVAKGKLVGEKTDCLSGMPNRSLKLPRAAPAMCAQTASKTGRSRSSALKPS